MKTILVVSYHFPPEEGSCSEKNDRIVKLLIDSGYKVIVLTKPGNPSSCKNANLKILRTNSAGIFHKSKSQDYISQPAGANIKNNKIKKLLSSFIIPDATIDWAFEGISFYKKNKQLFKGIDLILSISSPYSAHILSAYLSNKLNVPYVMCYGDPWIYEPKRKRGFIRYKIEFNLEKRLISRSAGILLITDWNKNKYKQLYDIPDNKISTYHIGYDKSNIQDSISHKNDTFNIIYGGSLDPVHRDPEPFIKAMREISGVNVTIYNNDGKNLDDMIKKYSVSSNINHFPIISASRFLEEMYRNDALILFGNKTPFQVPGKVFTYIATGKTIIYLKNNNYSDDGTEEVLKIYGNSIILENNTNKIIRGLNDFLYAGCSKTQQVNRDVFEFHVTMRPIINMINDILGIKNNG